jgi:hypothetical protein
MLFQWDVLIGEVRQLQIKNHITRILPWWATFLPRVFLICHYVSYDQTKYCITVSFSYALARHLILIGVCCQSCDVRLGEDQLVTYSINAYVFII